ncbi:TonB-dependent receptor plug domain-containing protein [Aquirufa regiilacus]|uniref:TonB-dependent receptor n=1 Tax=Aquirufa regiilacus TaxID=3024868 RepID=A0ABU3TPJ0_9BACT|nr:MULTISPECIES: TonB-dependent receptor [unclassified Aquirufa]MDT8886945.1 TonB-dependent receptor [Aquirufa sp. LEPPI-3A]MDU0807778.1 TonB-dependent receptor [Aquirufa sp. LEOWEIH-7C]
MNLVLVGLLSVRMAISGLSDTLVNVVVSASRQPIANQRLAIPVYAAKVQSNSVMNTPEVLSSVPGVFLQRTNQGGGSAFVRGLTGNQTLLVWDGIRFNNSTFRYGPNQYLNTIDPFSLDQIEVVRGSGSVQYGSDALTGAVHLISKKPSFGTKSWSGQILGKGISQGMELSGLARLNFQSARSSFSILAGKKTFGDITRGGNGAFQRPTGYEEQNLQLQYRQKLGDQWTLENLIQQNVQDHVPVYHKIQLEKFALNEMTLQSYRRAYSRLSYQGTKSWLQSAELTASIQASKEQRALQKKGSATLRNEEDQILTAGFIGQIKSEFIPGLHSTTGIEYYSDKVSSSRQDVNSKTIALRALYPDNSRYNTFSVFSLHEFEYRSWQVHAGLRYQQTSSFLPDTTVGNSTISLGAFVYDGGLSYAINPQLTFFGSLSSGFRAPNLDDLGSLGIVDFRYEQPAYQLKPEYSLTKNLGFRIKSHRFRAEWSAFQTSLTNLITRIKTAEVIQGYPVYRKENVDHAYLYGFEWSQTIAVSERFRIGNSISYVWGQNQTQKEPMRRIPPFNGNVSLNYQRNKGNVALLLIFADRQVRLSAGDKEDNRMNPIGTPGWGILQLQANYKITPHIQLGMQGVNLGNVPYRMHGSGIDGMGRSLHMQLGYEW